MNGDTNGNAPVRPENGQPQTPPPAPAPAPQPPKSEAPVTNWQYKTEAASAAPPPAQSVPFASPIPSGPQEATWSASEFIDHNKSLGWYVSLGAFVLVINIILYFWTHDFVSIFAVTAMAILLGVMASRKPRVLSYRLDTSGLTIGDTFHPYAEFKSFAIMDDGALQSITFLPLKRFMPPVSIFYDPQDQDKILEVLAQYLPMEMRQRDAIDRFSRRIRF